MAEVIQFTRRPDCPGVELFEVHHTARTWGHLNNAFAFGSMWDWHGQLQYRRRTQGLHSGDTFLFEPGELFHAQPVAGHLGSFRVIEVAERTITALCRAENYDGPLHFNRATLQTCPELTRTLDSLHSALVRQAEPLEQQTHLACLAHTMLSALLERSPRSPQGVPLGPCARLRELLHSEEGARLKLDEFARQSGVSQYQLLRAFKRRYGSPPHAYGLHVRLDRARRLLQSGRSVAEAAAAAQFTDQSHLTRHFRRIWGVTPGRYAAGAAKRYLGAVR